MVGFGPFLDYDFQDRQKIVDTINGDNLLHLAVRYRDLQGFMGRMDPIEIPMFTERNKQNMTPIELAESLGKSDVANYFRSILQQKKSGILDPYFYNSQTMMNKKRVSKTLGSESPQKQVDGN